MAVKPIFMALMPISHAVAWYLILETKDSENVGDFYQAVAAIAAFYCAWALYKVKALGDKKEKGHLTMGFLAFSATMLRPFPYVIMFANVLVILNFAVVIPFFLNRGVEGIVKMVHKEVNGLTMAWGYIFLAYLICNVVLWSYIFLTLWTTYSEGVEL